MAIKPIIPYKPGLIRPEAMQVKSPTINNISQKYRTFSQTLNDFTADVNTLQADSGKAVERFLTGEIEDVHDVMIAVEKASVSFELMLEMRNKMIEAYHEVFRMQV